MTFLGFFSSKSDTEQTENTSTNDTNIENSTSTKPDDTSSSVTDESTKVNGNEPVNNSEKDVKINQDESIQIVGGGTSEIPKDEKVQEGTESSNNGVESEQNPIISCAARAEGLNICVSGKKNEEKNENEKDVETIIKTYKDGVIKKFKNDVLHCLEGPAIIYPKDHKESPDRKEWWVEGEQITDEEQFVTLEISNTCGGKNEKWVDKNGNIHRPEYGPFRGPAEIREQHNVQDSLMMWKRHGVYHRNPDETQGGGPAYIVGDFKQYVSNGKLHNPFGPAYEKGEEKQWYINGNIISDKNSQVYRVTYIQPQKQINISTGHFCTDVIEAWFDIDGKVHRPQDPKDPFSGPGITTTSYKAYIDHGKFHNSFGPTVVRNDGIKEWYINDWVMTNLSSKTTFKFDEDGNECWYDEADKLHRDGDEPAMIMKNGTKKWYTHGELNRDEKLGPAVLESDGSYEYIRNGKTYRSDGPAYFVKSTNKYLWNQDANTYKNPEDQVTCNYVELSNSKIEIWTACIDGQKVVHRPIDNSPYKGPAIKIDDIQIWYDKGKMVRIENVDENKFKSISLLTENLKLKNEIIERHEMTIKSMNDNHLNITEELKKITEEYEKEKLIVKKCESLIDAVQKQVEQSKLDYQVQYHLMESKNNENKELGDMIHTLKFQLNEKTNEYNNYKNYNSLLESDKKNLKQENEILKRDINLFKRDIDVLEGNNEVSKQESLKLKEECNKLKEQIEVQKKEIERLQTKPLKGQNGITMCFCNKHAIVEDTSRIS